MPPFDAETSVQLRSHDTQPLAGLSPIKHTMLELNSNPLRHLLHTLLNIIIHPLPHSNRLSKLRPIKPQISRKQHKPKQTVLPILFPSLNRPRLTILRQSSTSPVASNLDPVNGGAEELVVPLHNPEVAANEDKFLREFVLVRKDIANVAAHTLLHFELSLFLVHFAEFLDAFHGFVVASLVGSHQSGTGEDVRCVDAPFFFGDLGHGFVVEGHQASPEEGVFSPEFGRHLDVETVVDQDEFGFAGGETADEDVARVWVAVNEAPEEHLRAEEVDHCLHYWLEAQAETPFAGCTTPVVSFRFELFIVGVVRSDRSLDRRWWWWQLSTACTR